MMAQIPLTLTKLHFFFSSTSPVGIDLSHQGVWFSGCSGSALICTSLFIGCSSQIHSESVVEEKPSKKEDSST
jgi:hypothetical protein